MMTDVTSLDSGFDAMDGIINSSEAGIHIRVTMPEDPAFQMIFIINPIDLVWTLKQKVLDSVSKDLKDAINYGFYSPPSNNRVGKFLDEERPIKEYPLSVPIGLLEFKYKKKLYKSDLNPLKLKKMHTPSELKLFMELVRKGDIDQLTLKMGRGFDPNFNSMGKGETPLTLAATLPRPGAGILALVGGGAFLDYRSRNGMTALHVATLHGNKDAVRILLDLGSSPNYKDSKGMTPLCYATTKDSPPLCIQWLLQERADIGRCDERGWMEIHRACEHGLTQHLEQLLYYGADRNAVTRDSLESPLHICARFNQGDCARLLLLRGADKNLKNKSQQTPEQVARSSGHEAIAKCICDFHQGQVELFTDVPKYNEKRRGTISMVTLRNLQRSRSNPNLLQQLFQQDPVLSATVSQAAGVLYISNGLVPNGVKNSSSIARPVASDLFGSGAKGTSKNEGFESSNRKHLEKVIELHRPPSGFGFILRGPIDPPGSTLNFMPTPEIPARQYIESVDAGSVAEKAGLEAGDFILEISGHDVTFESHKDCVQLMRNCGDLLKLKIAKVRPIASNGSQSKVSDSDKNSETQMKIKNSVTSDTLTLSGSKSGDASLASLEVLENLDAGLDSYDDKIVEDYTDHGAVDMPPPVEFMSAIHPVLEDSLPDHNDFFPSPPPPPPPPSAYSDSVAEVENVDLEVKEVLAKDDGIPSVSSRGNIHNARLELSGDSKQYSDAGIARKPLEEKVVVRSKVNEGETSLKQAKEEGGGKKSVSLAFAVASVAVAKEKMPEEPSRTSTLIKLAGSSDANRVQGQKKYPAPNIPRSSIPNVYSSRIEVADDESKIYESKLPIPSEISPADSASIPPPPPPPPPLPPAAGVVGTLSRSKAPSEFTADRKSASSGVQRQLLDETRKREESHAALMAAVMKRKNVLDSTDSNELADSINARVDGTLRLQKTVYRADNTKEVKSPPTTTMTTIRGAGLLVGHEGTLKRSEPSSVNDGTAGFSAEAEKVRQAFLLRKSTVVTSKELSGNGEISPPSVRLNSLTIDRGKQEPRPSFSSNGVSGGLEIMTLNRTSNRPGSSAVVSSQPVLADVASIIAQKALERQKKEEASAILLPVKPEHSSGKGSAPKQTDARKSALEKDGERGSPMTSATLPRLSTSRVYTSGGNLKINSGTDSTPPVKSPSAVDSTLQPKSYRSGITVVPSSKITSVAAGGPKNRASTIVASSVNNGERAALSIHSPQPGAVLSKQEAGGKAAVPAIVIPPPVEFATPAEPGFSNDVYATATLRSVSKSAPSNSMVFRARGGSASEPVAAKSFQGRPISLWNEKDVGEWLDSLDYSDYCAIFRERKITGNALSQVTVADMEAMGIKNPLHRIRIEKEIRKFINKK